MNFLACISLTVFYFCNKGFSFCMGRRSFSHMEGVHKWSKRSHRIYCCSDWQLIYWTLQASCCIIQSNIFNSMWWPKLWLCFLTILLLVFVLLLHWHALYMLYLQVLADTIGLPCRIAKGCKYCSREDASSCLVRFGLDRYMFWCLLSTSAILLTSTTTI